MKSPTRCPGYFLWAALFILLIGFILRIWDLGGPSLWHDEIFTARRAETSLRNGLDLTLRSGNQTPFYFASLHLFPVGHDSLLRYPSVLAGVFGIALLMRVVARFYGDCRFALLAGAVLALNPYHILISRTARPYAYLFTLTLLASYFFLLLAARQRTRAIWGGFILSSAAAYITHYFAGALPVAQYIYFSFILRRNPKFFRQWMGAQVIAGIPLVIWLYALSQRDIVKIGIGWIPRPGLDDIPPSFWNLMVGYDGLIDEKGVIRWLVIPGVLIAASGLLSGLVYAYRNRARDSVNLYWLLLLVIPFPLMFAASLFRPMYVDRYLTVFLPPTLLLMLIGLRTVRLRWGYILIGVVIVTGVANYAVVFARDRIEREDWRGAAAFIEAESLPGDAVLHETPENILMLLYYLHDGDMEHGWLLAGAEPEEHPEDEYKNPVSRLWVIHADPDIEVHRLGLLPDFDPFRPQHFFMSDWLIEHRDQIVLRKDFRGLKVFLVDVADEWGKSTP